MVPRLRLFVAVCALVCPLALAARSQSDSPLAISAALTNNVDAGAQAQGTLRLTIVNGGDQNVAGLSLRLAAGRASVDPETIEVGTVDMDATVVKTAAFRADKTFWASSEPLLFEASFKNQRDGNDVKATVRVVREGGAQ
jgi:hypothetical protein